MREDEEGLARFEESWEGGRGRSRFFEVDAEVDVEEFEVEFDLESGGSPSFFLLMSRSISSMFLMSFLTVLSFLSCEKSELAVKRSRADSCFFGGAKEGREEEEATGRCALVDLRDGAEEDFTSRRGFWSRARAIPPVVSSESSAKRSARCFACFSSRVSGSLGTLLSLEDDDFALTLTLEVDLAEVACIRCDQKGVQRADGAGDEPCDSVTWGDLDSRPLADPGSSSTP